MPFSRIDLVHEAGNLQSDDLPYVGENVAWVFDGATGLTNSRLFGQHESDAAHFVHLVHEAMLTQTQSQPLIPAIRGALAQVGEQLNLSHLQIDRVALPTSAVAAMRVAEEAVEFAVLGDCRVIIATSGGLFADLTDNRLHPLDEAVLTEMRRLQSQGLSWAEARQEVHPILMHNRRLQNTPEGYWTLGADLEAPHHARRLVIPRPAGEMKVLMMTDGLGRLLEFGLFPSPRTLLDWVSEHGLAAALRKLRLEEEADADCVKYARFKPKDDASAVYLELTH